MKTNGNGSFLIKKTPQEKEVRKPGGQLMQQVMQSQMLKLQIVA
jgi:hypothetical protein